MSHRETTLHPVPFAPAEGALRFDTPLGPCGLRWSRAGLREVRLPPARCDDWDEAGLLAAEPPPAVQELSRRVARHLGGHPGRFDDVPLDLDGVSGVRKQLYQALRRVGPGRTVSYGELAALAGRSPGAARAVGQAMAKNPVPLLVPCHRVLAAGGGLGGFSAPGGTASKLALLSLEGADLSQVARAGARALGRADPRLGAVIRRVGPFELSWQQGGDPLSALCEAIVHQQVSMKAGAAVFGRLKALCGGGETIEAARLLAASDEDLRGVGVSRQKAGYLRDLCARVAGGSLDLSRLPRLDDEAVIAELTRVKGIGRWSAEMYLIFRLGRLDVLPVGDLGLRRGVQLLDGLDELPKPAELQRRGELWRPYRSIATWYLWRGQDAGGLSSGVSESQG